MPFTTEEYSGCTNKAAKGANKAPRNPYFCFFISCFTVLVTPSINTPKPLNDFMILIISFISSFEMNKANPFPVLTARFPLILLSKVFMAFEAAFETALLTDPDNLSLAKEEAKYVTTFLRNLSKQEPKNSHQTELLYISELY